MLRYYLGGVAAALGLIGATQAQPAIPLNVKHSRPAFVPAKSPAVEQVKADAPAPTPIPPPAGIPAPAVAQPIAGDCPPAIAADVATAYGEPAWGGQALDCLCGPPGRIWLGGEYLLWKTSGTNLPPLATQATGIPLTPAPALPNRLGALGQPNTQTVIGGREYGDDWRSGIRLNAGAWLNQRQTFGVDVEWFTLGEQNTSEVAGTNAAQSYTFRPFINNTVRNADGSFGLVPPFQDTELVDYPDILAGTVAVDTSSRLWGLTPNALINLRCNPCGRLDFLIGYRYLNLTDTLDIEENLRGLPGSANNGATFRVEDRFRTENRFHGVNLGLAWERRFGNWFLGLKGSVGLGNTNTTVDINGATTVTDAAGVTTRFDGGLLTQPSNIGRYELNKFAVVPEVSVRLGVNLTERLRVYAGYNFLYWSNVVRTGDVVDLRVNGSQLPPRQNVVGDLFPRFEPKYSDFWAHGLILGLQFRY